VYITPLVVDDKGQKMSKSKGNSVDPIDLIGDYGADALRLAVAHTTGKGRTVRMPWSDLAEGRNFLNKLWNMSRFILMNLGDERPPLPAQLTELEDRYILSRLSATIESVTSYLEDYSFHLAAETLYDFTWHEVCDWYVEMAKPRLASEDVAVRGVLHHVLRETIKLLHPFIPFITEEIWQVLGESPASVSVAPYPTPGPRDEEAEITMRSVQEVATAVRNLRAELSVPATARLRVLVRTSDSSLREAVRDKAAALSVLCGVEEWKTGPRLRPASGSARQVLSSAEVFVPLAEWIDVEAESRRLRAELVSVEAELAKVEATLANDRFLARAPEDVVAKERGKQEEFRRKRDRLRANLDSLGG
jgi:valyl-tRNA synthetase